MDVDVKVQVHLGCAQQDDVQVVHACALAADARVLGRGNLHVFGVGANRFNRLQVKALYIQQCLKAALVEHVDHVSGDAAHAVAALDALFEHHLLDVFGGGQGRAARAGLEGEAVLEQAGRLDDLGGVACHLQAHRVAGNLGGTGDDAGRVADLVNLDDVVDINLRDGEADQRVGDQVVGDNDNLLGVHRVGECVADRAAGRRSDLTGAVAHVVGGWGGDEGHVDNRGSLLHVGGSAAVAAEDNRLVHDALRDGLADLRAHVVALDAGDHAVFDVADDRLMHVKDRACVDGQIFDAHLGNLVQHHVQHIVAVSHVVVEGNGHSVPELTFFNRFFNRCY